MSRGLAKTTFQTKTKQKIREKKIGKRKLRKKIDPLPKWKFIGESGAPLESM